ncbi:MAG TPA: SIMPL domain-containing protein, partial [Flavobacteriaceae bacterium]|nr:SIMPL domain-containing protein [Flavobacteriaceae bacterium]
MKNLLLTVALFGLSFASTAQTVVPGVTVSGEGVVYVKPDQVIVNVAVEHSGDYVEKVKQQTEKDVDAVIDFLKKQGIPSKNIKTEYIRLNQQYDYPTKTYNYSSTQGISIKIEQ